MTGTIFLWGADGRPAVIGHRGTGRGDARTGHRENTRAAFVHAAATGADWIETDVQLGADRALVLHHNIRDGNGRPIASLTADERRRSGLELLGEAIVGIPPRVGFNLELKITPGEADNDFLAAEVLTLIAGDGSRPWLVSSFDPSVLYAVRAQAMRRGHPAPPTGWITERGWPYGKAVLAGIRSGCQAVVVHADDVVADPPLVSDAPTLRQTLGLIREHQLAVAAWNATADNAASLIGRGVTGLCTDDIPGVRAALCAALRAGARAGAS